MEKNPVDLKKKFLVYSEKRGECEEAIRSPFFLVEK